MADLGTGVIILIVIWVIAFALLTLFTFVQSPVRFIGLVALVIAIIVTLVLTLLPRDNNDSSYKSINDPPDRYESLARILILTFLCVTFLVGVVMIFLHEILPQIFAQPIRKQIMSRGQDEPITVFLGDLSRDASKEEVEKAFSYYGKLRSVWLSRSPWGYGFIEFEDQRDAADAVKALDGKMLCGSRVRVEFSHGRGRSNRGGSGGGGGGGSSSSRARRRSGSRSPRSRKPFNPHDVCYECGDRGHYAYDCEIRLRRQRRMRSSSKSRSRSRSSRRTGNGHSSKRADKSRSRSGSSRSSHDRRRSYSRSRSGSDSPARSKERRSRTKSHSRSRASR
ncbi:hypothetical protein I4U23_003394 [Adineta vaga]|nr:hypothetical protein I4U23_003394 [Adineta vaga]